VTYQLLIMSGATENDNLDCLRSFYRTANDVCGKACKGKVILQLVMSKRVPVFIVRTRSLPIKQHIC